LLKALITVGYDLFGNALMVSTILAGITTILIFDKFVAPSKAA
jgi:hypothetical protein